MSPQPTAEQQRVIDAPRQNILVSAAAGSGKTTVMTDRIVARIRDGLLEVPRVLVVTFTEAAARNMRQKIEDKLRAARAQSEDPEQRRRLGRQLALLPAASISTIHAFCLQVIRDFYPSARDDQERPLIEPGFAVEDRSAADILLQEVLDSCLQEWYEAIDEDRLPEGMAGEAADVPVRQALFGAFYRLTDGYGDSRSDRPVRELILGLYHFLRSLPDYDAFVRERLQDLRQAASDFSASPHARAILAQLKLRLDRAMSVIPELEEMLGRPVRLMADRRRSDELQAALVSALQTLKALHAGLAAGDSSWDWDAVCASGQGLTDLKIPNSYKSDTPEKTQVVDLFCRYVAEAVCFLSGNLGTGKYRQHFIFQTAWQLNKTAAMIEAEIREMLPVIDVLFLLVNGLDARYTDRKRETGVIDFSDFEHLALAILRRDEPRNHYRERFQEIYIDEYQDTSSIQEAILDAIRANNCLMVGDIKQSIYRFRHARPQIFRGKASDYTQGNDGILLELNRNFRSVSGILEAVNGVFTPLMSQDAGEIDYDAHHALVPFRAGDPAVAHPVELMLLDRSQVPEVPDDEEEPEAGRIMSEDLSAYGQEALMVIGQMRSLHAGGIHWRDMAVLARTRAILAAYREQLDMAGVPVLADTGSMVMDAPVIRQIETALQLLDNARQDIPLASVMHGGIGPQTFSLDELAQIRLFGRQAGLRYFHEAVPGYREAGPDLALRQKLDHFDDWLEQMRQQALFLNVGELVGLVLTRTGWIDRVAAEPNGQNQVRLLRRFQAWSEDYESGRAKGLFRFVRYLENMRSQDWPEQPVDLETADEDAVRLLTIHGAKGLEFPVVFLVGTSGRIADRDSQEHLVLSENLGIGFDYSDPERRIRYPTQLKTAMLDDMRSAGLSEELRLLYVAMTRAMDRLIVAGTVALKPERGDTRLAGLLEQSGRHDDPRLPGYLVLSARSYLEWIVLALTRNPDLDLGFLSLAAAHRQTADAIWQVRLFDLATVQAQEEACRETARVDVSGQQAQDVAAVTPDWSALELESLRQRITGLYRHEQAARTPIKLTVSELKRQTMPDDPDRELASDVPPDSTWALRGIDLTLVKTDQPDHPLLHGASLGTALHAALRYLDLAPAAQNPIPAEIERQLDAMAQAAMLRPAEREALQPFVPALLAFVRSDLAWEILRAQRALADSVHQEMPFTLALPARLVYTANSGLAADDQVMVQGIIDLWYRHEGEITLVDFKSDDIRGEPEQIAHELVRRYANQLTWYARAIEAVSGTAVRRCLIWHIRGARAILVPLAPGWPAAEPG